MRYMLSLSLPGAEPWTHVLKTDDDCYVRLHRVLLVRPCSIHDVFLNVGRSLSSFISAELLKEVAVRAWRAAVIS